MLFINSHKRSIWKRHHPCHKQPWHICTDNPVEPPTLATHWYSQMALSLFTFSCCVDNASHNCWKKQLFLEKKRGRLQRGRTALRVHCTGTAINKATRKYFPETPTSLQSPLTLFSRWLTCKSLQEASWMQYCWQMATSKVFFSVGLSEAGDSQILITFTPVQSRMIPLRLSVAIQML